MLSVGDRVRIRGYSSRADNYDGQIGVVKEIKERFVVVTVDNGQNLCLKSSQLRKLIKLKEYWVGHVKYENDYTLWFPLVAHTEKPKTALDALNEPWVHVRRVSRRA